MGLAFDSGKPSLRPNCKHRNALTIYHIRGTATNKEVLRKVLVKKVQLLKTRTKQCQQQASWVHCHVFWSPISRCPKSTRDPNQLKPHPSNLCFYDSLLGIKKCMIRTSICVLDLRRGKAYSQLYRLKKETHRLCLIPNAVLMALQRILVPY